MGKEAFHYQLSPTFFSFLECMLNTQLSQAKKIKLHVLGTWCKNNLEEEHIWDGRGGNMNAFGSFGF